MPLRKEEWLRQAWLRLSRKLVRGRPGPKRILRRGRALTATQRAAAAAAALASDAAEAAASEAAAGAAAADLATESVVMKMVTMVLGVNEEDEI